MRGATLNEGDLMKQFTKNLSVYLIISLLLILGCSDDSTSPNGGTNNTYDLSIDYMPLTEGTQWEYAFNDTSGNPYHVEGGAPLVGTISAGSPLPGFQDVQFVEMRFPFRSLSNDPTAGHPSEINNVEPRTGCADTAVIVITFSDEIILEGVPVIENFTPTIELSDPVPSEDSLTWTFFHNQAFETYTTYSFKCSYSYRIVEQPNEPVESSHFTYSFTTTGEVHEAPLSNFIIGVDSARIYAYPEFQTKSENYFPTPGKGVTDSCYVLLKTPIEVGNTWSYDWSTDSTSSGSRAVSGEIISIGAVTVQGTEYLNTIEVAFKVEKDNGSTIETRNFTYWFAPDKGVIKMTHGFDLVCELISMTPG